MLLKDKADYQLIIRFHQSTYNQLSLRLAHIICSSDLSFSREPKTHRLEHRLFGILLIELTASLEQWVQDLSNTTLSTGLPIVGKAGSLSVC
jgi:hypothetical protein